MEIVKWCFLMISSIKFQAGRRKIKSKLSNPLAKYYMLIKGELLYKI